MCTHVIAHRGRRVIIDLFAEVELGTTTDKLEEMVRNLSFGDAADEPATHISIWKVQLA